VRVRRGKQIGRIEERFVRPRRGNPPEALLAAAIDSADPAIVYFHGGGHVIGSLDTPDFVARNLCAGTGAMVATVDYRMGPEHKFPAAVDDCFAALLWVHANAASLGTDPDQIGVHGDSAGGNLAAVASLLGPRCRRAAAAAAIARLPGHRLWSHW
jgi:acetyl esterase